jgi:hypothetical protein
MSIDRFADMLRFGINLKLSGPREEKYYAQRLRSYVSKTEDYDAESENDESMDIYFYNEKTLRVRIKKSTLTFEPLTGDSYDSIMLVLQFISEYHEQVQEDFKNTDAELDNLRKKAAFQSSNFMDDEENSEEDSEWI